MALEKNMADIRKMIGYASSTSYDSISNYQIFVVKSTILISGGISIIDQQSLLSAQAASIVNINNINSNQ